MGVAVGSGIFRTPGQIASELGSPLWISVSWLFGGLFVVAASLVTAELATRFPKAGAEYVFLREAYGNFFAFLVFLLTPILLYLVAVLVLPELDQDDSGVVSLREHYYEARPWFFGLTVLIPLATAARNAGFQGDGLWNQDRPFELAFFLLALTGLLTARERVHRILPVVMLALFITMVVLTSLRPG